MKKYRKKLNDCTQISQLGYYTILDSEGHINVYTVVGKILLDGSKAQSNGIVDNESGYFPLKRTNCDMKEQ